MIKTAPSPLRITALLGFVLSCAVVLDLFVDQLRWFDPVRGARLPDGGGVPRGQ